MYVGLAAYGNVSITDSRAIGGNQLVEASLTTPKIKKYSKYLAIIVAFLAMTPYILVGS
jgi:hypothetical protein